MHDHGRGFNDLFIETIASEFMYQFDAYLLEELCVGELFLELSSAGAILRVEICAINDLIRLNQGSRIFACMANIHSVDINICRS